MHNKPIRKILSLIFIFNLIFQQSGFAQMIGKVDIAKYLNQMNSFSVQDKFRPIHLRYFSYDALTNNFEILLDKGDLKDIKDYQLKEQGQELLEYFLIGITLPDENFWVNLRPDSESQIIDLELAHTDLGKILLEADLQLKKDTARFTSPETPEGRSYWNKLYQKAGQLFGGDNVAIPTLTRPWIVPQEVIIRETADSAYVYKATLKVMLEQDHLKNSADYNFKDARLKELNEYSSQLIRENIIPKLTKEVNTSKKYAALRQVFYSLILSRWFKARFSGKSGLYPDLINRHNLTSLTSQEPWSKTTYFKEYQKSFQNGEYNIKEAVTTLTGGQVIRSYFSGGIKLTGDLNIPQPGQAAASPLGIFSGRNPSFLGIAARSGMVGLAGMPTPETPLPVLTPAVVRTAASPMTNPQRGKIASSPVVPPSDQEVSFANMQLRAALDRLEPIRRVFEGERFGGMVARPILTLVRSSADEPLPLVVHKGEVHRLDRHSNMIVARPGPETPGTLIGGNMTPGPTFVDLTLVIPKAVTKAEVIDGLRAVGIRVKSAEASSDMLGVRGIGIPDLIVDEKTLAVIEVPNVGSLIDVKVWYDAGKEFVEPQPLTTEPLPVVRGSLMEPSKFTRRPRLPRTLRVGFNGFGRIGQMVERQIALFNEPDQIQVVAANDPEATAAGVAERLTYDTEHGQFPGTVHADKDGAFVDVEVDGRRQRIAISRSRVNLNDLEGRDLAQLPWRSHQVDVVIDAVGPFLSKEALEGHIIAGAKGVILTAPSRADEKKGEHRADFSLLIGVNDQQLHPEARVTDCASCTTNSYVPPQWVLGQKSLKVIAGNLLTVHAYTGTQALVDRYAREAERGRAGARNMILTDTGAGRATAPILPHLKGMLSAAALRLPVGTGSVSVSTNIMEVTDDEPLTVERVNAHFHALAETDQLKGILATERGLVSSAQLTGRSESSILLEDGTQVILLGGRQYLVRTLHWYDNEWGYSARIVDALYLLGEKLLAQEASPAAITVKSAGGSNERDASLGAKASSPMAPEALGGIDFRVINMITQPMGNFSGLNFTLPKLSHLEDINLDEELESIQKMLKAGIMPSGERLKEYVAACYQKGVSGRYIDGIINFLVDICRMQEDEISVTPDDIKALLLVVDSR